MSRNADTRLVTVRTVLASAAFRQGFDEVRRGLPLDPTAHQEFRKDGTHHAWRYERGRQFACVFYGTLKVGRRVTEEAVAAYRRARNEGSVI